MRLICPNCDAQYEVPDAVIPPNGRDVQCSDCGQTWYQHHPEHSEEPEEDEEVVLAPDAPAPPPRRMSSDVSDILREEAELESAARARDAESLESQPELGLEDDGGARRSRESQARIARIKGDASVSAQAQAAAIAAAAGSRRELLPDIEEINSTLRSTSDRKSTAAQLKDIDPNDMERGGGFWGGFIIVITAVAVLVGAYVYAPQIARAVPAMNPMLNSYVTAVDNGRVWLNGQVVSALQWLEEAAASQEDG